MSKLLTIEQVSEILQISKSTLYKWTCTDKIPHIKLSDGAVRFDQGKLEKWLKEREINVVI